MKEKLLEKIKEWEENSMYPSGEWDSGYASGWEAALREIRDFLNANSE